MIGAQKGKSLMMTVNILCEFIAPLIQLSTKQLIYRLEKKPNTILEPDYQPLVMKNISTLPVNVLLSTSGPFFICETDKSPLPLTPEPIKLEIDGEKNLLVKFDPSYRNDLNNWVAEEILAIKYMEHPQVDSLNLRGEVNYPNLSFETMELDFGCILNDTEVIRYITITNCSPLVVKFRWFFLVDNEENQIRFVSWPRKAYSAPLSQVESIPVTSASASPPAVPAIESAEMDLNDFVKTVLTDEDVGCEEREYKKVQVPTVVISDVRFPLHSAAWQVEGPSSKTKTEAGTMASVTLGFGWDEAGERHPGHFPTKHPQSQHPNGWPKEIIGDKKI
uniref:hydrocephalus-inducing protein homolog n=1 Tax=Halichoerus grypus TaxID=9711 RepID=UPI00165A099F|nr:hydrocephalus-inducing protein homolog [Halichoerus grypus]